MNPFSLLYSSLPQEIKALRLRETCEIRLKQYSKSTSPAIAKKKGCSSRRKCEPVVIAKPRVSFSRRSAVDEAKHESTDLSSGEDPEIAPIAAVGSSTNRKIALDVENRAKQKEAEPLSMIKLASRKRLDVSDSDSDDGEIFESNRSNAGTLLSCDLVSSSSSPIFEASVADLSYASISSSPVASRRR